MTSSSCSYQTSYVGERNSNGLKHGYGKIRFQDGSTYSGQFIDGLCSGHGVLYLPDGSVYEGEFAKGKFYGYGIYQRKDGMIYQGQFKDGKPEGYGLLTFPDGSHGIPRNEGQFKDFELKKQAKCESHIEEAKRAASKAHVI